MSILLLQFQCLYTRIKKYSNRLHFTLYVYNYDDLIINIIIFTL